MHIFMHSFHKALFVRSTGWQMCPILSVTGSVRLGGLTTHFTANMARQISIPFAKSRGTSETFIENYCTSLQINDNTLHMSQHTVAILGREI